MLGIGQKSLWQQSHLAFLPGNGPGDFTVESSLRVAW